MLQNSITASKSFFLSVRVLLLHRNGVMSHISSNGAGSGGDVQLAVEHSYVFFVVVVMID